MSDTGQSHANGVDEGRPSGSRDDDAEVAASRGEDGAATDVWVFGYGSLIWRPDMPWLERRVARLDNWTRRFWQGSHDHRGLPEAPGRVVTLLPAPGERCEGMAYRIAADVAHAVFEGLDHREKNGYERHEIQLICRDGDVLPAVVYIATKNNFAWLGPAPEAAMALQIRRAVGPSGANVEYLLELADALRELAIDDPHVFELEQLVRAL